MRKIASASPTLRALTRAIPALAVLLTACAQMPAQPPQPTQTPQPIQAPQPIHAAPPGQVPQSSQAVQAPQPAPAATPAPPANGAPHSLAEHQEKIRAHRMQRLADKLSIEPKVLKESCRYESDISTPPPRKRVALTFDDGPEPGQTELILATLSRYGIRATFFMIGEKVERHPHLVAAVAAGGHHLVANHSWNHPNFHSISPELQAQELLKGEQALGTLLQNKLFRYPYGNSTCETNALLKERGYKTVGWHVDSCDWAFDRNGSVDAKEAMECGVLPQYRGDYVGHVLSAVRAHHGGIILMHEIHPNTIKDLDQIIKGILADGYAFGSIDEDAFSESLR
jgi:peptidoglycan-N-acetylglucosamine deacetylase